MDTIEVGQHNPQPLPAPDYTIFCQDCKADYPLALSFNNTYWHIVDGKKERRCKASGMRKAYHDYRVKFISSPTVVTGKE
jgi:hypothetical protein